MLGFDDLATKLEVSKWDTKELSKQLGKLSASVEEAGQKAEELAGQAWEAIKKKAHGFVKKATVEQREVLKDFLEGGGASPLLEAAVQAGLEEAEARIANAKYAVSGNPTVDVNLEEVKANTPLGLSGRLEQAGFKPSETLIAFDFDLTLKAPRAGGWDVRGGDRLGLRAELQALAARGVELIVVTAARPEKEDKGGEGRWEAYESIEHDAKTIGVFDLMGRQFGAGPPEGIPYMQSATGKEKKEEVWVGRLVTEGKEGLFFQAGHGIVLAGYEKAAAIEHYIYYHGKRGQIQQVIFVDDAVSNVFYVGGHFKTKMTDNDFHKKSLVDGSERPHRSVLKRVDSIWWSTRGLLLDTGEAGQTVEYDTWADDSADNSYQETEHYERMRQAVKANDPLQTSV